MFERKVKLYSHLIKRKNYSLINKSNIGTFDMYDSYEPYKLQLQVNTINSTSDEKKIIEQYGYNNHNTTK